MQAASIRGELEETRKQLRTSQEEVVTVTTQLAEQTEANVKLQEDMRNLQVGLGTAHVRLRAADAWRG